MSRLSIVKRPLKPEIPPEISLVPAQDSSAFDDAGDAVRERARARLAAVERAELLHAEGTKRADADAAAALEAGFSMQAVGGWRRRTKGLPTGERLSALLDAAGRGRKPDLWRSPGADELWTMWYTDWMREEAPDAMAVYRRVKAFADSQGRRCPPEPAFRRRAKKEITKREIARGRCGALASMNIAPHQTRTVAGLGPLEILSGDGRRCDVMCRFTPKRTGRPVLWLWVDVYTRYILAWRVGETECADLIRLALHDVITEHGVPGEIQLDSTRAAAAKWLTGGQPGRKRWKSTGEETPGLLALLEIRYSVTAIDSDAAGRGRGRGRSKPVERAFKDLANQIDTHPDFAGAYTGRSTTDRPETHRTRTVDIEKFREVVGRCVIEHNARTGRRTEIAKGGSFDQAWARAIENAPIRKLTKSQASMILLAAEDVLIQPDGVFFLKTGHGASMPRNRYYSKHLVEHAGKRLVARFDPENLHGSVEVFSRDGRWLAQAECLLPVGFKDKAAAEEYGRARRRERKAAEAVIEARSDLDLLERGLREAAAQEQERREPAAKVIQIAGGLPFSDSRQPPAPDDNSRTGGGARPASTNPRANYMRKMRKVMKGESL